MAKPDACGFMWKIRNEGYRILVIFLGASGGKGYMYIKTKTSYDMILTALNSTITMILLEGVLWMSRSEDILWIYIVLYTCGSGQEWTVVLSTMCTS